MTFMYTDARDLKSTTDFDSGSSLNCKKPTVRTKTSPTSVMQVLDVLQISYVNTSYACDFHDTVICTFLHTYFLNSASR